MYSKPFKPLTPIQTPSNFSKPSTRRNTLSTATTSKNLDRPIFSFTEVIGKLEYRDTPETIQHPSLDSLDEATENQSNDFSLHVTSEPSRGNLHVIRGAPCHLRVKSERLGEEGLDRTLSTLHTLDDNRSTPRLSHEGDSVEKIGDNGIVIEELNIKRPQQHRTLKVIRGNMNGVLGKCKKLSMDMGKIGRNIEKIEKNYTKTLEDLDERLKNPVMKFEMWKNDEQFVKKRVQLKEEIDKFRKEYKESRKEQDKLSELDIYRQRNYWEVENKENSNLNSIEQLLILESKPYKNKKKLSREAQLSLRPKVFDVNLMPDRIMTLPEEDIQIETIDTTINILDRLPVILGHKSPNYLRRVNEEVREHQFNVSDDEEEAEKEFSNHVYYFTNLRNVRGHTGNVKKNQPKRFCRPSINVEGSSGTVFTKFKKSGLTKIK